jgi:hypothetical protein
MGVVTAIASDGIGRDITGYNLEHRRRDAKARRIPQALRDMLNGCNEMNRSGWSCAEADALTRLVHERGEARMDYGRVRISNPREDGVLIMAPCANCMKWLVEDHKAGADRFYRLSNDLLQRLVPRIEGKEPNLMEGYVPGPPPKLQGVWAARAGQK